MGSDWTKSKVLGIFAKRHLTLVDRSTKTLRSPVIVVVNATGFVSLNMLGKGRQNIETAPWTCQGQGDPANYVQGPRFV